MVKLFLLNLLTFILKQEWNLTLKEDSSEIINAQHEKPMFVHTMTKPHNTILDVHVKIKELVFPRLLLY